MKKYINVSLLSLLAGSLMFSSCGDDGPRLEQEGSDKYVIMTMSDREARTKPGFVTALDEFPTGTISNVSANSLEGEGMGGWRTYDNMIFKMFTTAANAQGIEKLKIAEDGTVTVDRIISASRPSEAGNYNGTGNLVIESATSGYYWDASEPFKIQHFNPTTMQNTGSWDFEDNVQERVTPDVAFAAIGQKLLAIKGGKLFANLTYAKVKAQQGQIGFFDDAYTDVFIAVIDIATGKWESITRIENTGSVAYINENHMYDFDTNGDLYIVTQGTNMQGLGGKSKIARIKANSTEVDQEWELNFSDFNPSDAGKFVNVFAKNGRLIFTLNTVPLTGGPTGNINSADIWEFYSLDVTDPTGYNKIEGIPVGTNPGAAMAVTEVDGKLYLRGSQLNGKNGYYEYDAASNSASLAFEVNVGGAVSGFTKIEIK